MIRRSLGLLVLILVFACGCTDTASPGFQSQPGDTAIVGVTVVPMSSDAVLRQHTVVTRGDRIVAIAPQADVAIPAGVTVIDGSGKWLMPGLADMHVHTWHEDDLTMFLAAGVTTVRNMWGVEQHLAWRSQIAQGQRLGPTIVTAGSLIDGNPPDWPGSVVLGDSDNADDLVIRQKAIGYDFLKSVSRLSKQAYENLAAAAKRHGMVLAGHVPHAVGLEGVLQARQRSIEHLDGYMQALIPPGVALPPESDVVPWMRAVLSNIDSARLPALIDKTLAAGTWNCPTLTIYERVPELYDVAAAQQRVKWLGMLPAYVRADWATSFQGKHTAEEAATVRAFNSEVNKVVAALAAANAPLLVGTDCGGGYLVPGESLHDEIELLVTAGIPRARVLRAATAEAWRYLGQPHEAGIVEVGARADLLLLPSDPLTAPLPLVPDGVMVRGHWLAHTDLETQLANIAKHNASLQHAWKNAPPLAAGDDVAQREHYEMELAGTPAGEERIAIRMKAGTRTLLGEIVDPVAPLDSWYEIGPDTASIKADHHTMKLALEAKTVAGKLQVTGTDLAGAPVSLSEPLPRGAFLSLPDAGAGGWMSLLPKLSNMDVGGRRTLPTLQLSYFPAIKITSGRYEVTREPDASGHRVFDVRRVQAEVSASVKLIVDDTGVLAVQTLDPAANTTITRR